MNKKDLIGKIELFADLLDFHGANKFKVNAFKNGANVLRRFSGDLIDEVKSKTLESIRGIGKGISSFVYEYFEHDGNVSELNDLLGKTPTGILDMMLIRGLGVKKVKLLYENLGIEDLESLKLACESGEIEKIKGFTSKTSEKILEEIAAKEKIRSKMLLHHAFELSNSVKRLLAESMLFILLEPTGELKRIREIVSKIEFIGLLNYEVNAYQKLLNFLQNNNISAQSSRNKIELDGYSVPVIIHIADNESEFAELIEELSSSPEFAEKLREQENSGNTEIRKERKKAYVIPEMREQAYFEAPEKLRTNSDLNIDDFKGLLHFHTNYSDGNNTLEQMIEAAENYGFRYAVVCDHSKSAFYANGLNEERIIEQRDHIEEINGKFKITLFQGIESDILNNGSLDYSEDILRSFTFVVASIHSNFTMKEEEMTKRIIKAIENPYTDLLAHPTGRLLLSRKGYKVNINKIIDACAANDVAIEINANPHRLDLDWRYIYNAREKGVKFSINADAHSIEDIEFTKLGILIARKGGVQRSEVINCFTKKEFIKFVNRKIKRYS